MGKKSEVGRYLSFGNVHEDGKAGHVVALAADVAVVPVEHFAALGGPAACTAGPTHTDKRATGERERQGWAGTAGMPTALGSSSRDGVVPEDADRLGPLLCLEQGVLQGEGRVEDRG